jgi:hypothetical protein
MTGAGEKLGKKWEVEEVDNLLLGSDTNGMSPLTSHSQGAKLQRESLDLWH